MNHRNSLLAEAERAMALFTVEMHMLVADRTGAVITTHRIFQCTGTVVDGMQQVVLGKERDSAEDCGFIHSLQ